MVEPVAVVGVGAEGNPPIPSGSLERGDFGGINGSSSSNDDSRTSSNSNNINDSRDLPALVGRPEQNLEVFDELTALGSGRTRSQSRGMTTSPSCANALLAYAITVEAKRTVEPWKTNELTIHCRMSAWRRSVIGLRISRGVMRC